MKFLDWRPSKNNSWNVTAKMYVNNKEYIVTAFRKGDDDEFCYHLALYDIAGDETAYSDAYETQAEAVQAGDKLYTLLLKEDPQRGNYTAYYGSYDGTNYGANAYYPQEYTEDDYE